MGNGVAAPVPMAEPSGIGVEVPLLFCVAKTEASFLDASPRICLIFLFRRADGFQLGFRNGRGLSARSIESRSC